MGVLSDTVWCNGVWGTEIGRSSIIDTVWCYGVGGTESGYGNRGSLAAMAVRMPYEVWRAEHIATILNAV
eukprot:3861676-Rhodomonas_salina.1